MKPETTRNASTDIPKKKNETVQLISYDSTPMVCLKKLNGAADAAQDSAFRGGEHHKHDCKGGSEESLCFKGQTKKQEAKPQRDVNREDAYPNLPQALPLPSRRCLSTHE